MNSADSIDLQPLLQLRGNQQQQLPQRWGNGGTWFDQVAPPHTHHSAERAREASSERSQPGMDAKEQPLSSADEKADHTPPAVFSAQSDNRTSIARCSDPGELGGVENRESPDEHLSGERERDATPWRSGSSIPLNHHGDFEVEVPAKPSSWTRRAQGNSAAKAGSRAQKSTATTPYSDSAAPPQEQLYNASSDWENFSAVFVNRPRALTSLYYSAMDRKLARQQWAAVERARQAMAEESRIIHECPFQPALSPYAERLQRPRLLAPQYRLQIEQRRRLETLARHCQEKLERELAGCTFRPLTLRAAKLLPLSSPRAAGEAGTTVHSRLFREGEARVNYRDEVRDRAVHILESNVYHRRVDRALSPEDLQGVVNRLFSKGVVTTRHASPTRGGGDADGAASIPVRRIAFEQPTFRPEINKESRRLLAAAAKANSAPAHRSVVDRLYTQVKRPTSGETLSERTGDTKGAGLVHPVEVEATGQPGSSTRESGSTGGPTVTTNAWSKIPHEVLALFKEEWTHSVVRDKCNLLIRAVQRPRQVPRQDQPPPHDIMAPSPSRSASREPNVARYHVLDLARAAIDLLTHNEADEVISILNGLRRTKLSRAELLAALEHFVFSAEGMTSSLATVPPPPPRLLRSRSPAAKPEPWHKPGHANAGLEAPPDGSARHPSHVSRSEKYRRDASLRHRVAQRNVLRNEARARTRITESESKCWNELVECTFHPALCGAPPPLAPASIQFSAKTTRSELLRREVSKDKLQKRDQARERVGNDEDVPQERAASRARSDGTILVGHMGGKSPPRISAEKHVTLVERQPHRHVTVRAAERNPACATANRSTVKVAPERKGEVPSDVMGGTTQPRQVAPPFTHSSRLDASGTEGAWANPYTLSDEDAGEPSAGVALQRRHSPQGPPMAGAPPRSVPGTHRGRPPIPSELRDRLYRDVIAEHAALGGAEVLSALGRELAIMQLRHHAARRR